MNYSEIRKQSEIRKIFKSKMETHKQKLSVMSGSDRSKLEKHLLDEAKQEWSGQKEKKSEPSELPKKEKQTKAK